MLFQVLKNGRGLMVTSSIKCIPSRAQLQEMQRAGYTFKLNGKAATIPQIFKVIADN
jgi:hypothetical protein